MNDHSTGKTTDDSKSVSKIVAEYEAKLAKAQAEIDNLRKELRKEPAPAQFPMRLPSSKVVVYAAKAIGPSHLWDRTLLFRRYAVSSFTDLFSLFAPCTKCLDWDTTQYIQNSEQLPTALHTYIFEK